MKAVSAARAARSPDWVSTPGSAAFVLVGVVLVSELAVPADVVVALGVRAELPDETDVVLVEVPVDVDPVMLNSLD